MTEFVSNVFFRMWYWYISKIDKKAEVIFMNYGYSKDNHEISLEEPDKINKYPVQLYDFVANSIDLKGKDLLEVGCGRGGGLSYINRYLKPKTATGIDLNNKAISFCQKNYKDITFMQGNAQLLKFENLSFDVVINVESSHRYAQIDKFLEEVHRVLRPGGHLIFTDFRLKHEIEKLDNQFVKAK
ncbi:MAG: class I SAM-dependent methyltransferase [Paludibacter sp.]